MQMQFDYTANMRRFALRFPVLNYLLLQVYFWLLAYALLAVLAYLVIVSGHPDGQVNLSVIMLVGLFFGLFNGLAAGYVSWVFEKRVFHNKAIGFIMISKAAICLIVFIILISVVRSVIYPYLLPRFFNNSGPDTSQQSWDAFFYLLLLYTIVIGLVISFI